MATKSAPSSVAALRGDLATAHDNIDLLRERIVELEQDGERWQKLATGEAQTELSQEAIKQAAYAARLMYLRNPLIFRAANIQAQYVFAQPPSVTAADPDIAALITTLMDDTRHQNVLFGAIARLAKDTELQLDGNLFFALIRDSLDGSLSIRTIPLFEIDTIITNPDDNQEVRFYRRTYNRPEYNADTGAMTTTSQTVYYPDWQYQPISKPDAMGGKPVEWDTAIYHVKTGGFSDWRFGISEFYSVLDWAKAYKGFLEDWSALVKAYAQYAWKLSTRGKGAVGAARAKLASLAATTRTPDTPTNVGKTFIGDESVGFEAIKGATVGADDGRRLLLMVAAGTGFPETFFGDVSVGTLATAESLDRPTELAMASRQQLWSSIYRDIFSYAVQCSVNAPAGALRALATIKRRGDTVVTVYRDSVNPAINIDFPPIVEASTTDRVNAIVTAAPVAIPDMKLVSRLVLTALGLDNVDEELDAMYPDGVETNTLRQPTSSTSPVVAEAYRKVVEAANAILNH